MDVMKEYCDVTTLTQYRKCETSATKLWKHTRKLFFMTQPRPEAFGFLTLSPFQLSKRTRISFVKWVIMTVYTAVCHFTAWEHISQCCEVDGKWFEISYRQYLWEMSVHSQLITTWFFSWTPPSNQANSGRPGKVLNRGKKQNEQLRSIL